MSSWDALKADTFRLCGSFSWGRLISNVITNANFRAIATLRLCQGVAASGPLVRFALPFCKVLHRITTRSARLGLQWNTEIGPGFSLTHAFGTRMSRQVRIGRNVTLLHGVTIGQRHKITKSGERLTMYPVIEDEVFIGPYAIIIGGVTIGRGSRIAGGAFVAKSVPPYSTVIGNPARVVRTNCVPDVMNPAPV
ncbi:MAG: serine acetyltransferase [Candidatus Acidiferrum sp.]